MATVENDASMNKGLLVILAIWLFALIVLWLSLLNPYDFFNARVSTNYLGDSFGIINGLVSLISLLLIWKAYSLQKIELAETNKALSQQEMAMRKQQLQDWFIAILQIAQNHLKDLKIPQELPAKYGYRPFIPNPNGSPIPKNGAEGLVAVNLALELENLEEYVNDGYFGPFKKYLLALRIIETKILDEDLEEKDRGYFSEILKSQVNDSEIRLYRRLKTLGKMDMPDGFKIIFQIN